MPVAIFGNLQALRREALRAGCEGHNHHARHRLPLGGFEDVAGQRRDILGHDDESIMLLEYLAGGF